MTKLIHVATKRNHKGTQKLFLRESGNGFCWFEEKNGKEEETAICSESVEEAIRLARKEWKHQHFETLNCGFRYQLPERDEHGINALFSEMTASYSTPTGVYFDEKWGHSFFVQAASKSALRLWKELENTNRL